MDPSWDAVMNEPMTGRRNSRVALIGNRASIALDENPSKMPKTTRNQDSRGKLSLQDDIMAQIIEANENNLKYDSNESFEESSSSGDDELKIKSHLEETKHFYIGGI